MRLVSSAVLVAALALMGLAALSPALAQPAPVDGYCALISDRDKVASDGYRLTDAASIIRQDRANFHRFGRRDRADDGDRSFASTSARARIPGMLERGSIEPGLSRTIVAGNPYICVDIYRNSISVYYAR